MKTWHKLVRDKIIEIIKSNGDSAKYHIIEDDEEYFRALVAKDKEELTELVDARNLDELADKQEVLNAIAAHLGYTPEQVEQARADKYAKRGGFEKRIFLESTD